MESACVPTSRAGVAAPAPPWQTSQRAHLLRSASGARRLQESAPVLPVFVLIAGSFSSLAAPMFQSLLRSSLFAFFFVPPSARATSPVCVCP